MGSYANFSTRRACSFPPWLLSRWAYQEDTVFAGTGTDEVFSCRSRLMDGGVYTAPVNLPFHKDP